MIFNIRCGEWLHLNGCHRRCVNVVKEMRHETADVLPWSKHHLSIYKPQVNG